MIKYKLLLSYDGTYYAGWQIQPNAVTVQELVTKALEKFLHEKIHLIGAGRTDAGVHALGQTAHFILSSRSDQGRFLRAANGILPPDIRILSVEEVPSSFQAQYSAKGKIYHYHLWLNPVQSPFQRLYSAHIRFKIDFSLLKEATQFFIGTHDFSAFANSAHEGAASRDPIRTIYRLDLIEQEGGLRLEFEGDGFLYKMVRNITGLLLEVGRGTIPLSAIPPIFASKNRRQAPMGAPAHGLFLVKVIY